MSELAIYFHQSSNDLYCFDFQSDSDSSTSDDDAPDEGTKRGEPNKFDILCDGVNNSMALVHTAMEEVKLKLSD